MLEGLLIFSNVVLISYRNSNVSTSQLPGCNWGGAAEEFANNIKNFFWLVGVPKGHISFRGADGDFFRWVFWGVWPGCSCGGSGNIGLGVGRWARECNGS